MSTDSSIPSDGCQISSDTGIRLKLLRELAGLSQRELAKRAGMTNSSISTIEQGAVSPSVQSLARILSALSISLPDFFAFSYESGNKASNTSSSAGLNTQIIILPACSVGKFSVPVTGVSGVVVRGGLTLVQLGGATRTLAQGESFCVPAGQLFRFDNPTDDELHLFVCSLFELPI